MRPMTRLPSRAQEKTPRRYGSSEPTSRIDRADATQDDQHHMEAQQASPADRKEESCHSKPQSAGPASSPATFGSHG